MIPIEKVQEQNEEIVAPTMGDRTAEPLSIWNMEAPFEDEDLKGVIDQMMICANLRTPFWQFAYLFPKNGGTYYYYSVGSMYLSPEKAWEEIVNGGYDLASKEYRPPMVVRRPTD